MTINKKIIIINNRKFKLSVKHIFHLYSLVFIMAKDAKSDDDLQGHFKPYVSVHRLGDIQYKWTANTVELCADVPTLKK